MNEVLKRVYNKGYKEVTIGIDNENYESLKFMYNKWGFTHLVKMQTHDYHYFDSSNQIYEFDEPTELYMKQFDESQ